MSDPTIPNTDHLNAKFISNACVAVYVHARDHPNIEGNPQEAHQLGIAAVEAFGRIVAGCSSVPSAHSYHPSQFILPQPVTENADVSPEEAVF